VPAAEECGWCKDRYGVSWLVVPAVMMEMLRSDDPAQAARVMRAMQGMKKIDMAAIVRA
jgi:predicted 3-demethylubiquinone-9 3-methyltransferase (glyoxalase superfamily)